MSKLLAEPGHSLHPPFFRNEPQGDRLGPMSAARHLRSNRAVRTLKQPGERLAPPLRLRPKHVKEAGTHERRRAEPGKDRGEGSGANHRANPD